MAMTYNPDPFLELEPFQKTIQSKILTYCNKAKHSFASVELYPEVFDVRAQEFSRLLTCFKQINFGIVADIGCGNGFLTALWSLVAAKVIGVDEQEKKLDQHSIGLARTKALLDCLQVDSVEIRHGSMERLPLNDKSVDVIFSSYVFDHILNLSLALEEIKRVLKPNGIQIHVVPDFRDKLLSYQNWVRHEVKLVNIFKDLIRPVYYLMIGRWKQMPFALTHILSNWIPPPHDMRKSFFQECWEYRHRRWENCFKRHQLIVLQKIEMPRKTSTAYVLRSDSL